MTDDDIEHRLRAVERALTDGDTPVGDLSDAAAVQDRLDALAAEVDELGQRLDALDATVQSLHGYVGELEAVNDRVERRADAARAAVERLEDQRRRTPDAPAAETATDARVHADGDGESAEPAPFAGGETTDALCEHADELLGAGPTESDDAGSTDDSLLDRVRDSL